MHGLGLGWWIKNPDDTGDSYATDMYPLADAVLTEQCNQYSTVRALGRIHGAQSGLQCRVSIQDDKVLPPRRHAGVQRRQVQRRADGHSQTLPVTGCGALDDRQRSEARRSTTLSPIGDPCPVPGTANRCRPAVLTELRRSLREEAVRTDHRGVGLDRPLDQPVLDVGLKLTERR